MKYRLKYGLCMGCIYFIFYLVTTLVKKQNKTPIIGPLQIMMTYIMMSILFFIFGDLASIRSSLIPGIIYILITLNIYYVLVMPILSKTNKSYSPIFTTTLWFIPNVLYIMIIYNYGLYEPSLIIHLENLTITPFIIAWVIIAILLFSNDIYQHFKLKNSIKSSGYLVKTGIEKDILNNQAELIYRRKKTFKLYKSNTITTPLSIGILNPIIVLPDQEYDEASLNMIFSHELTHIFHGDNEMKLFIIMLQRLFWFNPFLWKANEKCSEQLELLCDQIVCEDFDDEQKKAYATLLLNTAGNSRGFTTCLSASASSLKHRLQGILQPKKQKYGYIIVAICLCLLYTSFGSFAFTTKKGNASFIGDIEFAYDKYNNALLITDSAMLKEYLDNLDCFKVLGSVIIDDADNQYKLWANVNDQKELVTISDHYIIINTFSIGNRTNIAYYVDDGIDMNFISERLQPNNH